VVLDVDRAVPRTFCGNEEVRLTDTSAGQIGGEAAA
jgi:hypothetical protein